MKAMKDSGVPWIGKIPDEWENVPLFTLFSEHKAKNVNSFETNVLSLSYGKIRKRNVETNIGLLPESFNTYNMVDIGDIILRLTDLQNDKKSLRTGLVTQKGIITSAYLTLRSKLNLDNRYYHYLLHTYDVIKVIYNMGDGVRQNLKYSELSKLPLLKLSLTTQQRIADFLDGKCVQIDGTIAKEKELIAKLKEYRQSLITEAVTKGLDPGVPMKDSGIDWIGEIPAHWETIRLKHLCKIITGSKDTINQNPDGQYPFYVRSPKVERIDTYTFEGEAILMAGDGVGAGKVFHYANGKFDFHQRVYNLHNFKKLKGKFLLYYLQENFWKEIEQSNAKSTVDSIRLPMLQNFPICITDNLEQEAIAAYLDNKTTLIDNAIGQKEKIIEKLEQYKKSLIYEAVTGKMEV